MKYPRDDVNPSKPRLLNPYTGGMQRTRPPPNKCALTPATRNVNIDLHHTELAYLLKAYKAAGAADEPR
jgi:hypothetical protein